MDLDKFLPEEMKGFTPDDLKPDSFHKDGVFYMKVDNLIGDTKHEVHLGSNQKLIAAITKFKDGTIHIDFGMSRVEIRRGFITISFKNGSDFFAIFEIHDNHIYSYWWSPPIHKVSPHLRGAVAMYTT